jgi:hypothetical protein
MGRLANVAFAALLFVCLTAPCICAKDDNASALAIQKLVEEGTEAEDMQSLLNWAIGVAYPSVDLCTSIGNHIEPHYILAHFAFGTAT